MKLVRAFVVLAALVGLFVLAACEETTSGGTIVKPDPPPDAGLLEAGLLDGAAPPTGDGGVTPEGGTLPACASCLVQGCAEELELCGQSCVDAIRCTTGCDSIACEDRCLRGARRPEGLAFNACVPVNCSEQCLSAKATLNAALSYAIADCNRYAACNPAGLVYNYGSTQACVQRASVYYAWTTVLPYSGASATTYTQCVKQTAALSCDDFNSSRISLACQARGLQLLGQECVDDVQCESGFCATVDRACGKCSLSPGIGEACVTDRCAPGLACVGTTCVMPSHVGEPCSVTRPCEASSSCTSGVCRAASRTENAACGAAATTPNCEDSIGLFCSTTSNTCRRYDIAPPGGACGNVGGVTVICQNRAACTGGVCQAGPAADEACNDTTGPYCTFPDICVNGKCASLPLPTRVCKSEQ